MQKLIYLIIVLFIIINQNNAQYVISRQVISNTGGSTNMAGITMDYSSGEAFTSEIENSSYAINQGFHQYFTSTIATDKFENNLFKFYPNPVTGICYLELNRQITERSTLLIYNVSGRIIYKKYIENNSSLIQLDLSELNPGTYVTILKDSKNKNISSFKLIKI